ncbi:MULTISPECIES: iron ABC transporter permease [Cyanophyceae]|uniref:ABC transporter permease n=1 Tax=Cyanophyceae TaxID=3028117 RepID=UPI00168443F8|nr:MULTISPECIES: iron ABC transporter permease [Cyanophyceae]MBD1916216.1 iron ABC transporter permease [Phormidium sp. FACHB-77]MBD2052858.1 iron ABC transporter permease [Leptolyngbya sp. FACHB-60]
MKSLGAPWKASLPRPDGWTLGVGLIALVMLLPVAIILASLFTNSSDAWGHLAATVLPEYVRNSLVLMVGVGLGVLAIGVSTAWLVSTCQFWGRRWFEWLLLLPLAAPTYILAYVYTDTLEYFGPVQTALRGLFGWQQATDYWFPNIRSIEGAILLFSLTLYPYVYLLARVAFLEQSTATLEASRCLGCGPWRSFRTVALPLARPAIAAGTALALMETLNDFGTVAYFSVSTFTTGIYRTWFGMGDRPAAVQLSAVLLLFIFALVVLEQRSRRRARYYQGMARTISQSRYELGGLRAVGAWLVCAAPVLLGLIIPTGLLLGMTIRNAEDTLDGDFVLLSINSLILAVLAALLAVLLALVMAYGLRLNRTPFLKLSVQGANLGYAVPGAVIAVGTLIPLAQFDNAIDAWMRQTFGFSTGLLLSGTIIALLFAYLVRFLAVSFGAIEAGLGKIKPSLDDAARSLGQTPNQTLMKIHRPLLGSSLLTATMLVFVDVMKELPATLIIRPFNFDTLAVRVYQYAADERLIEASAPALAIILVGLLPVLWLSKQIANEGKA